MNWQTAFGEAEASLRQLGWKVLGAAAVLLAGFVLATLVRKVLVRIALKRPDYSPNRFFLSSIIWLAMLILSFLLALVALGVGAQVIGVMVSIGVALGLFADSFAGIRLLLSRKIQVGDTIEIPNKDIVGIVISTTLLGTTLRAEDGSEVLLPNQMIVSNPLKNRSSESARGFVSLQFVVKPNTDIDDLQKMISEMIPSVSAYDSVGESFVTQIEKDFVTLRVRFMIRPNDRQSVASEFLKMANSEFGRTGVEVHSLAIVEG